MLVESEIASNEDVCSRISNNNNLSSSEIVYDDENADDLEQESTSTENCNKIYIKDAASDTDNKLSGPEISWVRNGAYKKLQNSRKARTTEIRPNKAGIESLHMSTNFPSSRILNETSSKTLRKPKDSSSTRVKKNSQDQKTKGLTIARLLDQQQQKRYLETSFNKPIRSTKCM